MSGLVLQMRLESLALGSGRKSKLHRHWHPAFPSADLDRRLTRIRLFSKGPRFPRAGKVLFRTWRPEGWREQHKDLLAKIGSIHVGSLCFV